ncbi:MAG: ABC transporter ATP-binding protein, partial [Acidobacteria bacterium]|nr:ABC transporter ATP-binding protein [Acidobacteriota bacterium]
VGFWRRRPYRALDNLTLSIEAGEVFGFLGPNGAGKTTTLKLLLQLIFPTAGRAEILGRPAGDVTIRHRVGYLQENPSFYDHLTAEELMNYFAQLFGYSPADRRQRVSMLLDRVGIGRERRFQLRKLSKGMLQRVGIAQALLNDPEVIILDEPMSGLDPLGRRDVRALILELRDQGRTVFFSSHILADAEALCSRVAVLAGGRLAAQGRLAELTEFTIRGWELVMANLSDAALERVRPTATRVTPISEGRYSLELSLAQPPDRTLSELVATGASVVSLNPLRETLEDFFVQRVAAAGRGAREEADAGDASR